ncbi:MAG: subtilisin family serine protease [Planctomycetota bacterium]|jgi:subtilisin family serine protease
MPKSIVLIVTITSLCVFAAGQSSRSTIMGGEEFVLTASQESVVFGFRSHFNRDIFMEDAERFGVVLRENFPGRRTAVIDCEPKHQGAFVDWLRQRRDIRFAHPVYNIAIEAQRRGWYLLTNQLIVQFAGTPNVNQIQPDLDRFEGQLITPIRWLPGAYLIRVPAGADALKVAKDLEALRSVSWAQPNWLRFLGLRNTVPNDPLFGNQWHLSNTGQGGGALGADIKATTAWDYATGSGVKIAVIDTGVETTHPDLNLATFGYDPFLGAGVNHGNDILGHGTRCAGVAAAIGNNNLQTCGIAYDAEVLAISLIDASGFGTPTDEAACFVWAADQGADVITNSWGPDGIPFPLPTLVEQSFAYATNVGRNGLGCPIFWAAGNGNETIGPDQYVSSSYTIAVGATNNYDVRSSYSDFGIQLDLMAPSSGGSRSINTTDLGGTTTLAFGGTSSAAPLAAGTAALVLEVAPSLNWVQVGNILRNSADQVQASAANYSSVGHSILYGHGRLNAEQAVVDAIDALPDPLSLGITTTGNSDIIVDINNMQPFGRWLIGFSAQIFNPIGSGPLYGVGFDSFKTLSAPHGVIPFHYSANSSGSFHWGTIGLPPGLTLQAVAFEILPNYSFRASNVIQVTF